ncbi:TonB family protein [uncultured Alistipes sp.]|uniref:energy transducer TonB n=1 Tax=uncultured Alistipes sp. TaxID=538949 RepID=UPI0032092063
MEIKKNPKADLKNKRGLLLEIGLVISLLLVIVAFEYTPEEKRIEKVDLQTAIVEEQIVEITRQDQKPPEPPKKVEVKVIADLLQVVTNDTKITTEVDFTEFDEDVDVVQTVGVVEEEVVEEDQPFLIAETMPSFQGGDLNTFRAWVQQNVKFPQIALENGIQGRVVLSFVIEKDGRLTNIQVLQTPDRSLSEEAVRVLSKSPKWTPGKQRNQVVRVKYTLPVDFRVQN